jgi:hypothetical protein
MINLKNDVEFRIPCKISDSIQIPSVVYIEDAKAWGVAVNRLEVLGYGRIVTNKILSGRKPLQMGDFAVMGKNGYLKKVIPKNYRPGKHKIIGIFLSNLDDDGYATIQVNPR